MAASAGSCIHAYIHVARLQTLTISLVLLLACMVVALASAEEPPSGYRFELTHVDAHGNFTKDELIRRAAQRSRLRAGRAATTMVALAALLAAEKHSGRTKSYSSMLHYSDYEYLMEVTIRKRRYDAIADTGSSLIWMKPPKHETCRMFRGVSCRDKICASPQTRKYCEGRGRRLCTYRTSYGDGFSTAGTMCRETLQFRVPNKSGYAASAGGIAVGWSNETRCASNHADCDLKNYNGTVGLGQGDQSLVKQLGVGAFSYCLTDYSDNTMKSPLLLGSLAVIKASTATDGRGGLYTTPLLSMSGSSRYYVHLEYIEIGGLRTYLTKSETPNMFIDSGASFTVLEDRAHKAFLDHVNSVMHPVKPVENGTSICYPGTTNLPRIPDLELHFTGGAVLYIHKDKMMYVDEGWQVCLAVENNPTAPMVSVLGNFQQQNIHMHFDITEKKVSFVQGTNCNEL